MFRQTPSNGRSHSQVLRPPKEEVGAAAPSTRIDKQSGDGCRSDRVSEETCGNDIIGVVVFPTRTRRTTDAPPTFREPPELDHDAAGSPRELRRV